MSAQGEDRSDYQAVYPWTGFDFGFVKATEGLTWTGKTFPANWANLKKEGKHRGVYHFLHPSVSPVQQAHHFLDVVKAAGLDAGDMIVVDTEVLSGARSHTGYMLEVPEESLLDTMSLVDTATKAFMDEVKAHINPNRHPMITYTNHNVGQHLQQTAAAYPLLWFAWPSKTPPTAAMIAPFKTWEFWQWGIVNNVDRDAYNGTTSELNNFLHNYDIIKIVTDGKVSLQDVCNKYNNSAEKIVARTIRHGIHANLVLYLVEHPHHLAPMPKGINLWVAL